MKVILMLLPLILLLAIPCRAQNTAVTATVTDPSAHPYTFGTGYASLVCPGNQAPTYNNFTIPRTFAITGLDGNGTFTQVVYDVNVLVPTGCGYQWHITYKDGVTSFITGTITSVTGASVNESAAISAFSVPLPIPPSSAGPTLQTNGTANANQSILNLINGTFTSLTADAFGGVTINSTSQVGSSSGNLQYNCAGLFCGVAESSVTPSTTAITLTAGADTTSPLTIASHSSTQSATQLDISNQSTGGGGTGTLAAPLLVEGKGFGAFNPTNITTVAAIQQESQATAAAGLILTNKQAVGSSNRTSTLQFNVPDNGIVAISGGNAVGDGSGSYSSLEFDANSSLYGTSSKPGQLGVVVAGSTASTAQNTLTIWNPVGSGGGTAQDTFDICRGTTLGYCLAGFDAGGAAGTVQNVNGFFKGVTSGSMLYGANPIAGTPCRFLFPTATPTSAGQVLQTAASASIESIASCQQSYYSVASSCGTIVFNGACAPLTTANSHCIGGAATLSGGASTITGLSPAFTSSSTYFVTTSDKTTPANSSSGVPASATSITFAGTGTDVIQFIACGS